MPSFSYTAKNRSGQTVTGTVEAESQSEASGKIREMGAFPLSISLAVEKRQAPVSNEAGSMFVRMFVFPFWTGVNIRALAFFFRQMATLMAAGMSLSECLTSAGARTGGRLGRIVLEARESVQIGGKLSDTLARYPRVFNQLVISLVRAGERGGLLEAMFSRIASYLEYEIKIRQMISKTMFYPALIFLVIIVVPHVPTLFLKDGHAFAVEMWGSLGLWLPWAVLAIVAAKFLLQFESMRLVWDSIKILPPIIGMCARKIAMSRFSKAMAILSSAGLPISEAVVTSADACANVRIARAIKFAVPAINSGKGLTESLARTGVMLPMVMDMMSVGERTGDMQSSLDKVAEYMDDEVDATIHKLGIVMFVLAILIAAVIVCIMVVQFYGGYFGNVMKEGSQ